MRVLHVASEALPLIKTGGLADVCASLPRAQARLGHDVRLLLPAYRAALEKTPPGQAIAEIDLPGLSNKVRILEPKLSDRSVKVWLVDYGPAFDRAGNPYLDENGVPWQDNAERFHVLCRAAVAIILEAGLMQWRPEIVHCHDWQTGLIAPLLNEDRDIVKIFTIHNLSYQGVYPRSTFSNLQLPEALWGMHGIEYRGQMSFIKGGIVSSDWVTTVSPTYAREIQTLELGCGLEGLLQHRSARLVGIVNGIDYEGWNPDTDPYIDFHFDADNLEGKRANKKACKKRWGLGGDMEIPLFGFIGRLVEQKGVDLLIEALPKLLNDGYHFVVLGEGEPDLEQRLLEIARANRKQIFVHIGYDEQMSHQIEAAADIFLMPSRFEPCGLNQMYSQHYGTVPIVHHTGGLADTVVPATTKNLTARIATGFSFRPASLDAFLSAIEQALELYQTQQTWLSLMQTGMQKDFSWQQSAASYLELYRRMPLGSA